MERGWKPHAQISPPCPRCGSSNTKFCYYNNYSLTQPRYFCKGCRRYWTKGGSLRNVPVGGGCRKSRKGKPFGASSTHDNANGNGIPSSRGVFVGGHINHGMAPMLSESIHGSLAGAEGSNIDLALVYANFLNQKPVGPQADQAESHHHQLEIPLLPNAIGGGPYDSFQLSSVERINMDLTNHQLSRESSFTECRSLSDHRFSDTHFSESNASYFYGLDSIEKQQATDYNQLSSTTMNQINNYMLPALPGEELTVSDEIVLPALPGEELTVSDEKVWPADSDHHIMFPSHMLRANQLSGIESQAQEPDGQLDIENGSQFNDSIELCNVSRP